MGKILGMSEKILSSGKDRNPVHTYYNTWTEGISCKEERHGVWRRKFVFGLYVTPRGELARVGSVGICVGSASLFSYHAKRVCVAVDYRLISSHNQRQLYYLCEVALEIKKKKINK